MPTLPHPPSLDSLALLCAWYLVLSLITFAVYARDKSASRMARWRTRESNLHLLALLGGWPGAWLAQRVLRHKTKKTAFRVASFCMAAVNCMGLAHLLSRGYMG